MARRPRCLVVGEVLFDVFPDGDRLGGAPFNFAWHLQGLGLAPLMVSRLGEDERGGRIRDAMAGHGMKAVGLQRDLHHPTGTVRVDLDGRGGHRFEILQDQAYDHLDEMEVRRVMAGGATDLLYFGTLATRHPTSRKAILGTAASCKGIVFLDVNLRPTCWTEETLNACLEQATVAKLNDDELAVLADIYGFPDEERMAVEAVRSRFQLDAVILTRGASGALWFDDKGYAESTTPEVEVVDTVGAGDGFAAISAMGLLGGWSPATTLERAAEFAARICEQRGACPESPDFYNHFRSAWDL